MIFRKIYISRANEQVTQSDIDSILAVSRHRNHSDDLTGLLIFHEGMFFQVLEGDQDRLAQCYQRILSDPRHREIRLLNDAAFDSRAFPDWKMGYARPEDLSPLSREKVLGITSHPHVTGTSHVSDADLQAMVDEFVEVFEMSGAATSGTL